MKPRWLVIAAVLPTQDVMYVQYNVPTIIMSRACDQFTKASFQHVKFSTIDPTQSSAVSDSHVKFWAACSVLSQGVSLLHAQLILDTIAASECAHFVCSYLQLLCYSRIDFLDQQTFVLPGKCQQLEPLTLCCQAQCFALHQSYTLGEPEVIWPISCISHKDLPV